MRVTVDIDFFEHNLSIERTWLSFGEFKKKYYRKLFGIWGFFAKLSFWYRIAMGCILMRKLPEVRVTTKGLHLIWRENNISEKTMLVYRFILLDDINRILLDMSSPLRVKQVLFVKKEVIYHEKEEVKKKITLREFIIKKIKEVFVWIKKLNLRKN